MWIANIGEREIIVDSMPFLSISLFYASRTLAYYLELSVQFYGNIVLSVCISINLLPVSLYFYFKAISNLFFHVIKCLFI